MDNPIYIIGQIFGAIAVVLGFVSYQVKTQKMMLLMQAITALVFIIHYLLIDAMSGMALNIVALIRNFAYSRKDIKIFSGKACPIFFAVVMGVIGILSWQAWYSVFVVAGLVINSVCMSFKNPQNIRKSILVSSPLVLIYDIFVVSVGGAIYESVAIVSALLGIFRFRKENENQ